VLFLIKTFGEKDIFTKIILVIFVRNDIKLFFLVLIINFLPFIGGVMNLPLYFWDKCFTITVFIIERLNNFLSICLVQIKYARRLS